jgi:hypothetical protein
MSVTSTSETPFTSCAPSSTATAASSSTGKSATKWRKSTWKPSCNGHAKSSPARVRASSPTTDRSSSPRTSRSSSASPAHGRKPTRAGLSDRIEHTRGTRKTCINRIPRRTSGGQGSGPYSSANLPPPQQERIVAMFHCHRVLCSLGTTEQNSHQRPTATLNAAAPIAV